jgi:hypothetical protein
MTVGSGIAPDLLTLASSGYNNRSHQALAGCMQMNGFTT